MPAACLVPFVIDIIVLLLSVSRFFGRRFLLLIGVRWALAHGRHRRGISVAAVLNVFWGFIGHFASPSKKGSGSRQIWFPTDRSMGGVDCPVVSTERGSGPDLATGAFLCHRLTSYQPVIGIDKQTPTSLFVGNELPLILLNPLSPLSCLPIAM